MFEPINIRRTLLIARRDYLGYIKTWGFWISFIMPFVFGFLGFLYSTTDFNIQPVRYEIQAARIKLLSSLKPKRIMMLCAKRPF